MLLIQILVMIILTIVLIRLIRLILDIRHDKKIQKIANEIYAQFKGESVTADAILDIYTQRYSFYDTVDAIKYLNRNNKARIIVDD